MARYTRKELMQRVKIAIGELHLSSMTQADKKRLHYVEQGLVALDEEQSLLKTGIELLLDEHEAACKPSSGGLTTEIERRAATALATEALITGLKKLVDDLQPRVAYPDRKLLSSGEYLIWWTTEEECKSIGEKTLPKSLPSYIRKEYDSRYGRNARGRLWFSPPINTGDVIFPETPLAAYLGTHAGGIVIKAEDAPLLKDYPGVITTIKIERHSAMVR